MKEKRLLIFILIALASCGKKEAADNPETAAARKPIITHTPIQETTESPPEKTATRPPETLSQVELQKILHPPKAPEPIPAAGQFPVAVSVPDKPGFVFSPYNNKIIDLREMPPGTLVSDPTFPAAEKKYFRAP